MQLQVKGLLEFVYCMSGSLKGLCARTLVSSVVMLGRGGIFKREFSVRQLGY